MTAWPIAVVRASRFVELELPEQMIAQRLLGAVRVLDGRARIGALRRLGRPRLLRVLPLRFRCNGNLGLGLGLGVGEVLGVVGLGRSRLRVTVLGRGLRLLDLEHDVLVERRLDLRLQLHDRQLQQANGLLELRRHGQLLRQPQLQGRFQHASTLTGLLRGRILLLGTLPAHSYSTKSRPASPMPSMSRRSGYTRGCRFPVSRAHYGP